MSFKVPSLPKLVKRKPRPNKFLSKCKGLPVSDIKSLEILNTVASGSFGVVKLCQKNGLSFVLKELIEDDDEQERLFIKEANLMNKLHHDNIVKFDSIVQCVNRKYAFLMEYVHFDFSHFGEDRKISSLKDLLQTLDNVDCSGFEHLPECIAKDICRGLAFLHDNEVAHRDLKPDNVLISNQHYTSETINEYWEKKPIIAKLADFGESRSNLVQTSSLLHTRTENVNRGTPVFMAPELHRADGGPMNLEKLKSTDVWSMSMIFFMLINPDVRYPYQTEIKDIKNSGMTCKRIMKQVYKKMEPPKHSEKYTEQRKGPWSKIEEAFSLSAKFDRRPTAGQVQSILEGKKDYKTSDRNLFCDFSMSSSDRNDKTSGVADARQESSIKDSSFEGELHDSSKGCDSKSPELKRRRIAHPLTMLSIHSSSDETNVEASWNRRLSEENNQEKCIMEVDGSENTILYSYHPYTDKIQGNSSESDVRKSKAEDLKSVMGNFHQSTSDVFKHAAAGTQCITNCVTAIVVASLKPVEDWNSDSIDEILKQGDELHLRILSSHGWPFKRGEPKLDIDEMPVEIYLQFEGKETGASIGALNDASFGFSSDISSLLVPFLNGEPNKSFVLRLFGSCIAIICGRYQQYYIFDPHARNSHGDADADGSAGLFHFRSSSDLVAFLQRQCGVKHEQVDLYPIDVQMLGNRDKALMSEFNERESPNSHTATPVFRNREKGLTLQDIISICAGKTSIDSTKICGTVPKPKPNVVYAIDMEKVGEERDLTCDDSGTYDSHSSPSALVEITMDSKKKQIKGIKIISRSKVSMDDPRLQKDNTFLVKRLYSVQNNKCGKSQRIVSKVYHQSKLCRYALVQYLGERYSILKPHGNSKIKTTLYMRTKPSVILKEKKLVREVSPKQVINIIDKQNSLNSDSPSDLPRDRQQVYNIKKGENIAFKARNTGKLAAPDFSRLVASMDNDGFVKNIDFSSRVKTKRIHPNTFAATENMLRWTKTFCHPDAQHKSQLGIDMTYKVGPFYTTCLSFPHPMFVHKGDNQKHPTIFAGMSTSTGRQKEDYMYLAGQLKANGIERLIYGTDGELALELGFENVYPIEGVTQLKRSIKLRCFHHVKDDLLVELKKYPSIENKSVIKSLLGAEFNGKRDPGLVDSRDFEEDYRKLSTQWPEDFLRYMESKELKVRSLKDTLKKSMGRDVRIAAGLGNPPNKFDNQRAESMNNVLKESLGSQFVDQASVHDLTYENVVIPQERELIKAIYGHGEYRLAPSFKKLEVHPLKWGTMSEQQRQSHINRVFQCKMNIEQDRAILRKLSYQPNDCKTYLSVLPNALINDLWKNAELILSYSNVNEIQPGHFCVAEDDNAYIIKETLKGFSCQCPQFKKLGLCGHTIAIADDRGRLEDVLKKFKYDPSLAVYNNRPQTAGEKRGKKPRKGKQNIKKIPIESEGNSSIAEDEIDLNIRRPFQYCEIGHNDEPFKIVNINRVNIAGKKTLYCATCNSVISTKNAVPPFDIMFTHQERYKYPHQTEDGKTIWKTTKKKTRAKFYCIKKECLLKRHPYFWFGLVDISEVSLKDVHLQMLREVLGFEI